MYHARTKHIDIKYHFLREKVKEGVIELAYKPTDEMIADGSTKALNRIKHESASTYEQVLRSKYKDESMRAMECEIKSLMQHKTWTLKKLPKDKKSIGCK